MRTNSKCPFHQEALLFSRPYLCCTSSTSIPILLNVLPSNEYKLVTQEADIPTTLSHHTAYQIVSPPSLHHELPLSPHADRLPRHPHCLARHLLLPLPPTQTALETVPRSLLPTPHISQHLP